MPMPTRQGIHLYSLTPRPTFLDEPLRAQLGGVLDAAIAKSGAAKGNIQVFDVASGTAEIVVQRGFGPEFLHYFKSVSLADGSACARALLVGRRVIIENVDTDPEFAPHRGIAAASGFRAVQSTPLFTPNGCLQGVLSTHFPAPRRLTEAETRLIDAEACAAANLIALARLEREIERAKNRQEQILGVVARELNGLLESVRAARRGVDGHDRVPGDMSHVAATLDKRISMLMHLIGGLSRGVRHPEDSPPI